MNELTGDEPFTDMFLHAAGISEVPPQYFYWAGLSLLASCLENRVYMEKFTYQKIFPNLYVFLVGKSASGKGVAIKLAQKVLQQMEFDGRGSPPVYRGSLTRAAIHDEMVTDKERESSPLFFVCPELGNSIGTGQVAKDLIKFMTDVWEGDIHYHQERTRTHGKHILKDPCLNVLAGTTSEWCREVIDHNDLRSGFWARVVCVQGERDYTRRIYEPDTSGWSMAAQWLSWRLSLLLGKGCEGDLALEGPMHLSQAAKQIDKQWYESRPAPESDLIDAHWARQQDVIWKIAMLLKLGDYYDLTKIQQGDESWRVIEAEHILKAQHLSQEVMESAGDFVSQSMVHHYNGSGAQVMAVLQKAGTIQQSPDLLRKVAHYGLKAKELNKIIEDLEDQGKVQRGFLGAGKIIVKWVG